MTRSLESAPPPAPVDRPIALGGADFARYKYAWYPTLLESAPVCRGRISLLRVTLVSRYDDCRLVLGDERFVRNRALAKTGKKGSPLPIPMPRSIAALTRSMIYEDDPEHRRLRGLVNQAFTGRRVGAFEPRVESITDALLDVLEARVAAAPGRSIDLLDAYAQWIPMRVISALVGIREDEAVDMERGLTALGRGLTGMRLLRTMFVDMPRTSKFVTRLIERKRAEPDDDVLSALIEAEEAGDRLSTEELVAMVFLLILAGLETTEHLIANGIRFLLEHPEDRARIESEASRWPGAVDEMVRVCGPVHGTKPVYPTQDVELSGCVITRGTPIMPLLGAANRDPRAFEAPDRFDETRSPNPHLGFGYGMHFCLGRQLALMEARVALQRLLARFPALRLDRDAESLEIANWPLWHRHLSMPVVLD